MSNSPLPQERKRISNPDLDLHHWDEEGGEISGGVSGTELVDDTDYCLIPTDGETETETETEVDLDTEEEEGDEQDSGEEERELDDSDLFGDDPSEAEEENIDLGLEAFRIDDIPKEHMAKAKEDKGKGKKVEFVLREKEGTEVEIGLNDEHHPTPRALPEYHDLERSPTPLDLPAPLDHCWMFEFGQCPFSARECKHAHILPTNCTDAELPASGSSSSSKPENTRAISASTPPKSIAVCRGALPAAVSVAKGLETSTTYTTKASSFQISIPYHPGPKRSTLEPFNIDPPSYLPFFRPTYLAGERFHFESIENFPKDIGNFADMQLPKVVQFGPQFPIDDIHIEILVASAQYAPIGLLPPPSTSISTTTPSPTTLEIIDIGDPDTCMGSFLTNTSAFLLARSCPNLISISLDSCPSLTDAAFLAFIYHCSNLRYLAICGNSYTPGGITSGAISILLSSSPDGPKSLPPLVPHLKELILFDQPDLTTSASTTLLRTLSLSRPELAIKLGVRLDPKGIAGRVGTYTYVGGRVLKQVSIGEGAGGWWRTEEMGGLLEGDSTEEEGREEEGDLDLDSEVARWGEERFGFGM